MSYWNYAPYVSVAERRAKAAKKIKQLKKKNPDINPIVIDGRTLATSWWGQSWNRNLERYADYSNRIGRGRNYVRHGSVLDLKIGPGKIAALVQGSRSTPYQVHIQIKALKKLNWMRIKSACEGKLDSLQELLAGNFPKDLQDVFMAQGAGLFPTPEEIEFSCSCPDWAYMCKHVAATLYGVGKRLDESPHLFFELRKASIDDLITQALGEKTTTMLNKAKKKSSRVIDDDNLGELFGIVMEDETVFKKKTKPLPQKTNRHQKALITDDEKTIPTDKSKQPSATLKNRPPGERQKSIQKKESAELEAANLKLKKALQVLENARQGLEELQTGVKSVSSKPIDLVADFIIDSKKGVGIKELVQQTGLEKNKLYSLIHRLKKQGQIRNRAHGIYERNR